ncbi:MAG: hypothetical protein WKG07_44595 [Hymenobacter sp.]
MASISRVEACRRRRRSPYRPRRPRRRQPRSARKVSAEINACGNSAAQARQGGQQASFSSSG